MDDGEKRKEKAEVALWNLIEALSIRFDYLTKQVAWDELPETGA